MATDKRCAASEIQHVKNTFVKNFAKSKQMHARKTVCSDDS